MPQDFEPTGEELARIHQAANGYSGPASRYTLDLHHLVERPLAWLKDAPAMDGGLKVICPFNLYFVQFWSCYSDLCT